MELENEGVTENNINSSETDHDGLHIIPCKI